ncbi:MAG: MFS transporter [Mariprofundales bacterium]
MNLLDKFLSTSYIQILTERNFRQLWLATLISRAGDILHDIAVLWLVSEETGSALAVGAVIVSTSLPVLLFRLIGGAIADRFNRQKIMIATDLLRAVLVLALPLLYYFQSLNLPAILVITFLRAVLSQFFYPAQQAVIPSTVPKASLPVANSVNQTSSLAIATSIPVLSGILIATVGPVTAFYIDAITFILSAILLFGLRLPTLSLPRSKDNLTPKTLVADIRLGIAYIFHSPILRIIARDSEINNIPTTLIDNPLATLVEGGLGG